MGPDPKARPEWEDGTRAVRAGEELDVAWLERFLAERVPGFRPPLSVEQFPGGHSNLTYLLRAGDGEWVLRRPPFGAKAIKAGHDMAREYRILSALHPAWGRVPRPLAFAAEGESPLGAPFYVMERARGLILRGRPPPGLELGAGRMRRLSESFVDNLVELHAIDYRAAGLADLGRPEGYLSRQVGGWTERYLRAKTDELPEIEEVARWLAANLPREQPPSLLHNDFKYDNLVLDPEDFSLRAVLDWEMSTLGDPVSDVGMALAYWIEAGDPPELRQLQLGLTHLPGNLTRAEVVDRYARLSGRDASHIAFCYALGLFKVAVIAQQIYARFKLGLTRDERFAGLLQAVRLLGRAGLHVTATRDVTPARSL